MIDPIDRQQTIDAVEQWEDDHTWDDWCNEHKDEKERFHIVPPSDYIRSLPSAEPTDEAVKEYCRKRCLTLITNDLFHKMSSAEPERHWIPCSERLPDRFGKMLVTFIPAAGTLWTQVIIAHYSDLMGIARPCFWIGNVGKNDFANITSQVVAWMPLPEPWKGGEDE